MIKVIQASFSVIVDQWRLVLGILLLITLNQILISKTLKIILGRQLTSNEYFSLGMAGWMLPASLISLLWFLAGFISRIQILAILFIILVIVICILLLRLKTDLEPDSKTTFFFLLLLFSISIPVRLLFVSKAILPSYFDSAQHYALIKNILGNNSNLTTIYYHLGFHFLAAFITSLVQASITKTMLIFGQMILAVMPVSFFFLTRHETKSNLAGILAVIFAAFGWYMPAHAVDWGKYPALMSLGLIPFGLSLAYLSARVKDTLSLQKRRFVYGMFGLSILVSGFAHSRSVIIFMIAFLAWIISTWQQRLQRLGQYLVFLVIIISIIAEIIFIQSQDVFAPLFDPYFNKGLWITVLVIVLSIFAIRAYPQFAIACVTAISFLLASLFIPVPGWLPGYANLTLLDRPYVEMILYMPFTLLGGLGLAGLEKYLSNAQLRFSISLMAIGVVLIHAVVTYDFYPSDCCVIAGNDDIAAMEWMNQRLPSDARIGISTTTLKVLVSESFEGYVGSDAGIWIAPFINRVTIALPYTSDFSQQNILNTLCQMHVSYLYIGERGQTFNDSKLKDHPGWYKMLLSMPRVRVYQVVGCK